MSDTADRFAQALHDLIEEAVPEEVGQGRPTARGPPFLDSLRLETPTTPREPVLRSAKFRPASCARHTDRPVRSQSAAELAAS
jgi:hypothetical protein